MADLEPGHARLKPCPNCGRDEVYSSDESISSGTYFGCDSCGMQLDEDKVLKSPLETLRNSGQNQSTTDIPDEVVRKIVMGAKSEHMTPAQLRGTEELFHNVLIYLEQDEQPHYVFPLTKGLFADPSLVVDSGAEQSVLLDKNAGGSLVISNRYVRIISDTGEWTIPFSSISSVDIVGHPALHIHTEGRTYYIKIAGTLFDDEGELDRAAKYIRQKQRQVSGDMEAEYQGNKVDPDDPLQQIEKLNQLKEKGAISEEEFNKKKNQLLDEI